MHLDCYWFFFWFFFVCVTSWGEALYSKDCVASTQSVDLVTSRLKTYVANC